MKIVIASLLISCGAFAMDPPSQALVDQYVNVALGNDAVKIADSGPISCQYETLVNAYGTDPDYKAFGKTTKDASQRLALLCIKERCNHVGQLILGSLADMDKISDDDTREYLKSQGRSTQEIETIIGNLHQMNRSALAEITCANSTPTARMVVVDSCFTAPMNCK
jgi:hypothetical protein